LSTSDLGGVPGRVERDRETEPTGAEPGRGGVMTEAEH
jgi:hypothetical protein